MGEVVTEPAPAKVNPFLRVLGRRDDGYHDIETLILPVTLADGVQVTPADELRLTVIGDRGGEAPRGHDNLVIRAARALAGEGGERGGAHVLLSKQVPVAAGLGGGSADAAATLRALDELWGTGLGPAGLERVAVGVGSDVPALLHRRPVLVRGRGERVEPIDVLRTWWVLLFHEEGIAAGDAYRWWDEDRGPTGPDPSELLAALGSGDPAAAGPLLSNDLAAGVLSRRPDVRGGLERLRESGAAGAVVCGSGPTVAGLATGPDHAEEVAAATGGTVVASLTG